MISAYKHGDICQVVNCIETKPEFSNLVGIILFRCTIQFCNVLKILILEFGIIINPQCRTLTVSHSFVNEAVYRILISSLVIQKAYFRGASIICILNKLFGYCKSIGVFLQ